MNAALMGLADRLAKTWNLPKWQARSEVDLIVKELQNLAGDQLRTAAAEGVGEPVAYLHYVSGEDGEPDQALSFTPDSFPLEGVAGYRKVSCQPLYAQPDTSAEAVAWVEADELRMFVNGAGGPFLHAGVENALRSVPIYLHPPTDSGAGRDGWLPIESAPDDGTPILIAAVEDGQLFDVLHGHFEVLTEDEEDGPWDIRDGEPWCSYEGRAAGIYFCHWLPEKEWESRWKFGPNTGYTHWQPIPPPKDTAIAGAAGEKDCG